jgi:hypothetical protein
LDGFFVAKLKKYSTKQGNKKDSETKSNDPLISIDKE